MVCRVTDPWWMFTNEQWGSYILNQAVKLTFLGPLGMARWNIEACLEIVRGCEDLYLLIDQKIERTQQVIQRLESATESAAESVARLDVLRDMLEGQVDKLSKTKQDHKKAVARSKEQREQRIARSIDARASGRRVGLECLGRFETSSRSARNGETLGRFATPSKSTRNGEISGRIEETPARYESPSKSGIRRQLRSPVSVEILETSARYETPSRSGIGRGHTSPVSVEILEQGVNKSSVFAN